MPGLVAISSPVIIGLVLGPVKLGGTLAGATATGVLLALFMANAGGAWDNAKKAIEQGEIDGAEKEMTLTRLLLLEIPLGILSRTLVALP